MNNPARKPFSDIWQLIILLLAGWLIFNLVQTVQYVTADYPQIPVADYWRVPQFWPQYRTFHWSSLWVQHNEHRILFPELVYTADMFVLHGRMYLPIALSGLCYLGVWFVFIWAAYSQRVLETPLREVALLFAGIVIGWKGCSSVIAAPFQLAFTMTQVMVALALACLAKAGESGRLKYLTATIVSAGIATYSVGNGMLVWPVLVAAALLLKVNKRQILMLVISAVLLVSVYFVGYHPLPSLIGTNVNHPVLALEFFCSYLSMPFGSFRGTWFGIEIGAVNLLLMGGCFAFAARRGLLRSRLGMVLFGPYLFTLLSALLTTAGRMDLNDLVFAAAKTGRYVTMPTVGWASLAIAVVWLLGEGQRSTKWALAAAALLATFFGYGFVKARHWVEFTRLDAQNAQVTATMLRDRVLDPDQVRTIFPDVEFVRVYSKVLREDHKSIWAHGEDKWIGQDARNLRPDSVPIAGKIMRVYPVPGGLELFGWADANSLTEDHAVLFVDSSNTIVGFGRRPAAGMPADLGAWEAPNRLTFVGFVSLEKPLTKLSVYVRASHGGLVSPLDGTVDVPKFTLVGDRSDKAPLPGFTWQWNANWTLKGYPLGPFNGPIPKGEIYGSWTAPDGRTGLIHSNPIPAPLDHCLVLPVLHGEASSYGQLVEVRDGESDKAIAKLPMLDGRSVWERWRIPLPDKTRNVAIVAEDRGAGPNQWVAVATPEECP